ncbi:MAG: capsule assembly Wzi family protein [bacterium]|nr:capsule assembly Wzi family protein [bacterium]
MTLLAASGNVPLDSDVYRSLDLLTSQGLLRSHLAGTRPITWAELHRLVEEAKGRLKVLEEEDREVISAARAVLKELEKSIYDRFTGSVRAGSGSTYAAVHDPGIEFEYLNGDPSGIPGIKASQAALVYNNGGIDPDEGLSVSLMAEMSTGSGPFYLQLYPRFTTSEEDREFIHRGSLRVGGLAGLELNIARESLWWGQGAHGGLYLTNNTSPLPMVSLSTPHPSTLPWIFRYLGPFRFELFVSELEEDRAVPEPYFMGLRTNFRPFYALEIGLSNMVMTGGEGRPEVSFGDLFKIFFGGNDVAGDRSNNIAGIDLRLNLPGWQFYLEFGGEDEAGGLPSKMAGMAGFYFPGLPGSLDLRLEYADLAYTKEIAEVWYRHGTYTDGYTYDGRILGHHVGGGGRDLFMEMGFGAGERGRGRVGVDFEQRGLHTQPAVEHHAQLSAGWEGLLGPADGDWTLKLDMALDWISNKDYSAGEDRINGYVTLGLEGRI